MSYRATNKYRAQRAWHPKPAVPVDEQRPVSMERPDVCIRITVERFDCGAPETHVVELRKSRRVDSYRAEFDGMRWMPRIGGRMRQTVGLSVVLAALRKAMPRRLSPRHCGE